MRTATHSRARGQDRKRRWPEESRAVTVVGVVLTRAFLALVDAGACAPALRALLHVASSTPLDPAFALRLVTAVLDETAALPGLSAGTLEQIDAAKGKHETDAAPAEWRLARKAMLIRADTQGDAVNQAALEIAAALAWPTLLAAKTSGDVLRLLCATRADVDVEASGIPMTDRDELMAIYQAILDEDAALRKTGETPRSVNDVFHERYPVLFKMRADQWTLYGSFVRSTASRLLAACLDGRARSHKSDLASSPRGEDDVQPTGL